MNRAIETKPDRLSASSNRCPRVVLAVGCLTSLVAAICWGGARGNGPPPVTRVISSPSAPTPVAISGDRPLPRRLSETGLYLPGRPNEFAPGVFAYSPQYPLWSDGATKRRWVWLPPGTRIDASKPDDWELPIGTRFWKEFSFGQRTETRYLERLRDGSYRYASYVWDARESDAWLAPSGGLPATREIRPGVQHDVPSEGDCRACHEGRRSPVLGFGALQLSSDRDSLAPHRELAPRGGLDLAELVKRDLLRGLPASVLARAPRIVAPSATARASAGYLFANCAHCHNGSGPLASLGLDFDQSVGADARSYERMQLSVVGRPSRYKIPGQPRSMRVSANQPARSALWFRMQSRFAAAQMPPLGTKLVDVQALSLIERWIATDPIASHQPR